MNRALATPVSALIERLRSHERESEAIFLELGHLFGKLVGETDLSAQEAGRQVDEVLDQAGARNVSRSHVAGGSDLNVFLGEAERFFQRIAERDREFLQAVEAGAARLANLDGIIARVRADSEEMEIVSLNAMTVALRSGSNGRAFSVITEELKRLAARTIGLTHEIGDVGRELLESFRSLGADMAALDATQGRFFARVREDLSRGFAQLSEELRSAASSFSDLSERASKVRDPIAQIMQRVQLQDIIRQSLDHVILSLEEAIREDSGSASEADEFAFAIAVTDLSATLLGDVIEKVEDSATSFSADIRGVVDAVETCEAERQRFVGSGLGTWTEGEGVGLESRDYLDLKLRVVGSARRLEEQVHALDDRFKVLGVLLGRFRNIVTASRIETARNRALSIVSNTVSGMGALTELIETDSGEAQALTKTFIKTASAAIQAYAEAQARDDERVRSTAARIELEFERLKAARQREREAIQGFTLYTPGFIGMIGQARERVSRISQVADRLRMAQAELVEFRRTRLDTVGAAASPDAERHAIANERLRRMIERFTIFTHKKAAGLIGEFAVEEGATSGEVTLF